MQVLKNPALRLRTLLWLVAAHSAGVGLGLILHPASILSQAGYAPVSEPFFPVQGGVFHLVMALGYSIAAVDPLRHRSLVIFAILVKCVATVFLVVYWLAAGHLLVVLASGIMDGFMAALLAMATVSWDRAREKGMS